MLIDTTELAQKVAKKLVLRVAGAMAMISHLSSPSRILEMRGEHRMRDRIPRAAQVTRKEEAPVGIFWLVKGKLLIDSTPAW